jgi:mycothiol synthase
VATPDPPGRVSALDPFDGTARSEVDAVLARAEKASGHPGLAEPSRIAWTGAGGDFVGLVLREDAAVVGYAQLGWRDRSWTVEIVLDPDGNENDVRRELLVAATSEARARGATELRYWANQHDRDDEAEMTALGFTNERDLLQMRCPLPLDVDHRPLEERFALRAFRPGDDEAAWLDVNNRAFAAHPEQSHWERATLLAREETSWFDPDGFILCEAGGVLAGSCWTKVHADRVPALGEIYVISVDPSFQHHGLGRALCLAGLDWLAARVTLAMLYVEATNDGAVALYRSLGFSVDHVDRCYLLELRSPEGRSDSRLPMA